ncbi:MAG TPA: hypothetical protein VGQ81_12100 [Acidobacteriota bacterium]|nr:hypothetical protein [Acidobacteriota bacterium]
MSKWAAYVCKQHAARHIGQNLMAGTAALRVPPEFRLLSGGTGRT